MKVCIVEDSEIVQGILSEELSKMKGVTVCEIVHNPDDAVRTIRENRPDLVILDIVLKGGNGFEVLKKIKREDMRPRVLVLTNYAFPQYRDICRGLGAELFFDKSLDMTRALQAVREMA